MFLPRGSRDRPDVWELRLRLGRDSDLSRRELLHLLGLDRWVILRNGLRALAGFFGVVSCIGLLSLEKPSGSAWEKANFHANAITFATVAIAIASVCVLALLLVSRRIRRIAAGRYVSDLRDPTGSTVQVMRLPAPSSAARQSVSSLRAAHALLLTVVKELERARPGIFEMSENTRLTLESRARRIVLIERTLAEADGRGVGDRDDFDPGDSGTSDSDPSDSDPSDSGTSDSGASHSGPVVSGTAPADQGYEPLRRTRMVMAERLRIGVRRYEELVAQAVSAGDSWQSLEMDTIGATAATEELAAWEAGMREVQQIARVDD